jgi:hypothetical protein
MPNPAPCLDSVAAAQPARPAPWLDHAVIHPPLPLDLAEWPPEQLWLHPEQSAFRDHRDQIEEVLRARLLELPRWLRAGPLGCATAPNVNDFVGYGQPDRAWRLAARLLLAARSAGVLGCAGQIADDLAVSALFLAGEVHGCVLGAMEAAAVMGDLADRAAAGGGDYLGLALPPTELAIRICRRRRAFLDRVASRVALDGGSARSVESLMWRAPVAPPDADGSGEG